MINQMLYSILALFIKETLSMDCHIDMEHRFGAMEGGIKEIGSRIKFRGTENTYGQMVKYMRGSLRMIDDMEVENIFLKMGAGLKGAG